jgi:hypothetical protein
MEIHSVGSTVIEAEIDRLKQAHVVQKKVEPYADPLREFARISRVEGMVRHWMTYPLDEKKRLIRDQFEFVPQMTGETVAGFETRQLERWRALCVILQEESRLKSTNGVWAQGSVEIATACLKLLFPFNDWTPKVVPAVTPEK